MLKRAFLASLTAITLIFSLASCQSSAIDGTYLGMDIDKFYAELKFTPGEDTIQLSESPAGYVELKNSIKYLGDKYVVWLTYPVVPEDAYPDGVPFYYNKIDSIIYRKDFSGATTATVTDTVAKIFSKLTEEYAAANPRVILEIVTTGADGEKSTISQSDSDLTALTKDKLLEELESTSYGDAKMTFLCNWSLPDKLEKLDQDYVNAIKELNNSPLTYVVNARLEYVEERYLFTITHTFERVI